MIDFEMDRDFSSSHCNDDFFPEVRQSAFFSSKHLTTQFFMVYLCALSGLWTQLLMNDFQMGTGFRSSHLNDDFFPTTLLLP